MPLNFRVIFNQLGHVFNNALVSQYLQVVHAGEGHVVHRVLLFLLPRLTNLQAPHVHRPVAVPVDQRARLVRKVRVLGVDDLLPRGNADAVQAVDLDPGGLRRVDEVLDVLVHFVALGEAHVLVEGFKVVDGVVSARAGDDDLGLVPEPRRGQEELQTGGRPLLRPQGNGAQDEDAQVVPGCGNLDSLGNPSVQRSTMGGWAQRFLSFY